MKFGKIDYLNLLPFHVFLKRQSLPSYVKKGIEYKKGVPSAMCRALHRRGVDAAVISSIESRHKKFGKLNMGIVAKGPVKSVLVRKNSAPKLDPASRTSNMLARVLGVQGEVIIGDRALKAYISEGGENFIDLAVAWQKKFHLPFVFARFCYVKNGSVWAKLVLRFVTHKQKIPRYVLKSYAKSRKISENEIQSYLRLISYKFETKEARSLRKFLNLARRLKFNPSGGAQQ